MYKQGTDVYKCSEIDAFLFFSQYLLFISLPMLELERNYHKTRKKRQNIKDEEEEEVYIYKGIKLNALCVFHFVPMIEYINISFSSVYSCIHVSLMLLLHIHR